MKPTKKYLEDKFHIFNEVYFHGHLSTPTFKITSAKNTLGRFVATYYRRSPKMFIYLSSYYDMAETDLDDTIAHEMIHQYIFEKGINDTSSHGVEFQKIAAKLNSKGRNITIKKVISDENAKLAKNVKFNVFRFYNVNRNGYYELIASSTSIDSIKRWLTNMNYEFKFKQVSDVKYASYKKSQKKAHYYAITKEDYDSF